MQDALDLSSLEVIERGNLRFACYDVEAFGYAYREVFDEAVYRFRADSNHPFIIDAGANLGLATCFFKTEYPDAEILAFEPDPRLASLFTRNIQANDFHKVTLRRAALSGRAGVARLHGDLASASPHALGNSLREDWGRQQADSVAIDVATEPLSRYLDRTVDLLKLDIEGLEGEVLAEAARALHRVHEIRMEVHQTRKSPGLLAEVHALLRNAGFVISTEPRALRELLPAAALPWFEREQPEIFLVSGSRTGRAV